MAEERECFIARDLDGKIFMAVVIDEKRPKGHRQMVAEAVESGGRIERITVAAMNAEGFGKRPFRLPGRKTTEGGQDAQDVTE